MPDFGLVETSRFQQAGTLAASDYGTNVAAAGTINVDGTVVQLVASSPYYASGFLLGVGNQSALANMLLDVCLGASTAEWDLVPDILVISGVGGRDWQWVYVPIAIPDGSRVSVRMRSSVISITAKVSIVLMAGGFPSEPMLARATNYGSVPASSTGLALDPGVTVNTKAVWAVLSASTTNEIKWLLLMFGRSDATLTSQQWRIDLGIGAAAAEYVIVPDLMIQGSASSDDIVPKYFSFPVAIPKGSRLVVRCQSSLGTVAERELVVVAIGID